MKISYRSLYVIATIVYFVCSIAMLLCSLSLACIGLDINDTRVAFLACFGVSVSIWNLRNAGYAIGKILS